MPLSQKAAFDWFLNLQEVQVLDNTLGKKPDESSKAPINNDQLFREVDDQPA